MKKGSLVEVKFGPGVRFGIIVSTEIFNLSFRRQYFVSADKRRAQHNLEVAAVINGGDYALMPATLMSINDVMETTIVGEADTRVTEEVCKRIRLIMDLG